MSNIDEIMGAIGRHGDDGIRDADAASASFEALRELIAAALAAKDAEIERLKAKLADSDKQEPAAWRIKQGARVYIISNAEFVRSSFDAASMTPLYDKPQPAAGTAKPEPGEWIEWAGGECPIADGVRHQVLFRDGDVSQICNEATPWSWLHDAEDCDIVAYRVLA